MLLSRRVALALSLALTVALPHAARAQRGDAVYVSPVHRWTVAYPVGWTVDSQNVASVQLRAPSGSPFGLVGIHTARVPLATADELIELVLAAQRQSPQGVRVLARRAVRLSDSTPAVELETELGTGVVGRSHRLVAVVDGTAYVLDAESYGEAWPVMGPIFRDILRSFRVRPAPSR
jgi:hypothetical protein